MKLLRIGVILVVLLVVLLISTLKSAEFQKASGSQVIQAIISACLFEESINSIENVSIYVMGNDSIANFLQLYIDRSLGKAILKKVSRGENLPAEKPNIMLVCNNKLADNACAYSQENNVLSITNIPKVVEKGISLGVGVNKTGEPKLLLNSEATIKAGKSWKKPIFKKAKIIR